METKSRKLQKSITKRKAVCLGSMMLFLLPVWLVQTQRSELAFGSVVPSGAVPNGAENNRGGNRIGVKPKEGMIFAMSQNTSSHASPEPASEKEYGVVAERDVGAKMRDGVKLFADVYRPAKDGKPAEGKFPVVLIRTIYDKGTSRVQLDSDDFVRRGYVVVIQDARGRFKSEGHFYHGVAEELDGDDTIEWIAQQPWCNGKIGMTGRSYLAAVQSAAAVANPPHLASIFHVKAPSNYYQNGFRHAGALLMYTVSIAFMKAEQNFRPGGSLEDPVLWNAVAHPWKKASDWLSRMPLKKGLTPISLDPHTEQWFFDMMTQTDYNDFWKKNALWQPEEYFDRYKDIPGYYVGGWYDLYREETFYTGLSKRKKSSIRLLMGPWIHSSNESSAGDVDFGPQAALSDTEYNALQLRWFDQTLKGKSTGLLDEPPVKIFVMGGGDGKKNQEGRLNHGGEWRLEKDWPLARTQCTNYYFYSDNTLRTVKPRDHRPSTYVYDPKNPVPTIGGTSYFLNENTSEPYVPFGAYDQREKTEYFGCKTNLPLSSRHDVLVFQTPALIEDTEITGPLMVKLWISSSAVDTDFTAKLIDVYPPNADYPEGYAMNLSDSIIRARYRNGFGKAEMLEPGKVYEISIDMPPTSNFFKKGHRIRVDISSSNYPTYDPNPNTGDPYFMGSKRIVAENTIYHDDKHPSHIVLPIIPVN